MNSVCLLRCHGFLSVLSSMFITTGLLHAQWTAVNTGLTNTFVSAFAVSGTNLFAGTYGGGAFLLANNGTSWTAVNTGLTNTFVNTFAVSGTNLFAATNDGVFLSTNNGTSWTAVNTGLTDTVVNAFAVSGTNLFAGTHDGVFLSTNNGTSWTAVNIGLTKTGASAFAVSGTNLFAGTSGGIFLSTNNGTGWTAVNSIIVYALAVSGTNLFAGTSGGVFLSTNNGTSWREISFGLRLVAGVGILAVSDMNIFAVPSLSGGVFLSTNNGTSWTAVDTGLTNTDVRSLAFSGTNLFAGIHGGGVWRRPLSEMTTSVERLPTDLPAHFCLNQNYPNPFNPSTTISYAVPKSANVSMRIFNTLGQEVALLVNKQRSPGYYQIQWNATVPSGIYFYRLQAGEFVETRKMILLK